ncbi:hypothetical protein BsWGS_04010 [Bradybaena similaris]
MLLAIFSICAVLSSVSCDSEGWPAFSALINSSPFYNRGEIIKYPVVKTNNGNFYNPATGVFTAGAAGFYFFHVNAQAQLGKVLSLGLYHNQVYVLSIYASSSSHPHWANGSNGIVLKLNYGDTVCVKARGPSYLYGLAGPGDCCIQSVFAGFKVGA